MSFLVYRHNRITRLTHWINALALLILLMSGLQIFNAYPHLHWGEKSEPDEAFFSISAADEKGRTRGYTSLYGWQIETTGFLGLQHTETGTFPRAFPSWLTIPGYFWLAGGRRWHFFFAWIFVLNGLLYVLYNLATGHLRKFLFGPRDLVNLMPMILYYLRLRRVSPQRGDYNPLQRMAYTGVLFVLTPLIILSGLAMSPQMNATFNWLPAMFGGRQSARSIHFILTFLFALFTFSHIFMVAATGAINNMRSIVTGWFREKPATDVFPSAEAPARAPLEAERAAEPAESEGENEDPKTRAVNPDFSRRRLLLGGLQTAGLFLLAGCDGIFNRLHQNRRVLSVLESAEEANRVFLRLISRRGKLAQEFSEVDISRYFKPNGNPPPLHMEYLLNAVMGWPGWKLEVGGLVKWPIVFSLPELKEMPARTQITRHDCVEGWSAIAKWKGVPLIEIMRVVEPNPEAKYVVFYCMDTDRQGNYYYESIDLYDAEHPQTILAYEMNGEPLPVDHGALLRLRVETQLGYKMAKYIHRVEFVASLKEIGQGRGGYWEDRGYEWYAGI